MSARFIFVLTTVTAIILIIDIYGFFGIRQLTANMQLPMRRILRISWFVPSVITLILFVVLALRFEELQNTRSYSFFALVTGFAFLFLLPKIVFFVFHFADDITHLGRLAIGFFKSKLSSEPHERMTRMQFFNQIGLAAGAVMLGSVAYGITKGKYAFRILSEKIHFNDLPEAFDGVRVVHISDAHLGSFLDNSFEEVGQAIDMINDLQPDYIFFTGDMVNNYAFEAEPWIEHFSRLKAKSGKYSILGNHDYGDYVFSKDNPEHVAQRKVNLARLKEIHAEMGFNLLCNQNALLERNGQTIRLLGMENWGHGFQKYGDLKETMTGATSEEFKILLSHDPTHWEQQVMGKENIHLTLSGHTHGMQFGVELPSLGIKFSPSQFRYKRWGGLYTENNQHIYVNRGFGFLGFPGRVGMPPEITCLDLHKA
jgi:predicted MPP superfamily phosphohydrolase